MISQTIEYALRAMMHLAGLEADKSASSEAIAHATKVPQGYLSKVLRDLVVSHLITSQRGPNGGFALARPANSISMLDVVNAVDPLKRIRQCPLGNPEHLKLCPLHHRLDNAMNLVETEFQNCTLAELRKSNRLAASGEMCRGIGAPPVTGRLTVRGAKVAE